MLDKVIFFDRAFNAKITLRTILRIFGFVGASYLALVLLAIGIGFGA